MPSNAKLGILNDAEKRWMAGHQMRALMLGRAHGDAATATAPSFAALDRAWVAEGALLRESGGDPNPLIQALGIALGQHLVDHHKLDWCVATDSFGTEVACYGKSGDVLVYPLNLVAKRWQRSEGSFLVALVKSMDEDIGMIQGLSR